MKASLVAFAVCAVFTGTAYAEGIPPAPSYTAPGVFFSIKNNCGFTSAVTVADKICSFNLGTWTATRPILSGTMLDQQIVGAGACSDKVGGDGKIVFFHNSTAPDFIEVAVKPGSTVDIPKELCSNPADKPFSLDHNVFKIK